MKTNHFYILATSILLFMAAPAFAQVKVGANPTIINANSVLELEQNSSAGRYGLRLPLVALTGTSSAAPLSAHVQGMTVYNTATAGSGTTAVTPGEYYNDGTKWVMLAASNFLAATTTESAVAGWTINGSQVYAKQVTGTSGGLLMDVVLFTPSTGTASRLVGYDGWIVRTGGLQRHPIANVTPDAASAAHASMIYQQTASGAIVMWTNNSFYSNQSFSTTIYYTK